ncbi:hypothetical protein ACTI_85550 [Actinoplanes sp. OR16]|nr:hypothetical protein ACTI_85550 [Actinoplanes sp. OR16]
MIRLPFLSLATGTTGAGAEWAFQGEPVGDRQVPAGQQVELHAWSESVTAPVTFDVVTDDFLVSGSDTDRVTRIGADTRRPQTLRLAPGQTLAGLLGDYRQSHPGYAGDLLIVTEQEAIPPLSHAVTWWTTGPTGRYAFAAHLGGPAAVRTERALAVGTADGLQIELRYEDGTPMSAAEIRVELDSGPLTTVTDAGGVARVDRPLGSEEPFRVFLLSYPQTFAEEPTPAGGSPAVDPEVVTVFAFDSSFPAPAVYPALARVRDRAAGDADLRVRLYGHTDARGDAGYNRALSERRARTVLAMLTGDLPMFDEVAAAEGWDPRHYQAMLRGLGCDPGAIDGAEGPMTRDAVRRFQEEYNRYAFHHGAARRPGDLTVDGSLGEATRAALRDAYVCFSPHLAADRLAGPPFVGCGEDEPVSGDDAENRRVTVAYRTAEQATGDAAAPYREVVDRDRERPGGPPFADLAWLREETGTVHLSALTALPDGSPARFTVYPAARPLPAADSSAGQPRPAVDGAASVVAGQVAGGVAFARWEPGAPAADRIFDHTTWLDDHDFPIEAENDAGDLEPGGPADPDLLFDEPGIRPPVFAVESGEQWAVSGPPGQPLDAVRFGNAVEVDGIALRTDGAVITFGVPVDEPPGWSDPAGATAVLAMAVRAAGTEPAAAVPAGAGPPAAAPAGYGGYDLRRDDRDADHTYAGAARTSANGDPLPAAGTPGFVRRLQDDLRILGFHIAGPATGTFGLRTEWAVREFQIYAKMAHLAAEDDSAAARYADRLRQVANTDAYTGPVSGVVNARTRTLIQTWLAHRWRCPVVVESWNMRDGARTTVRDQNVWLHDEVTSSAPRVHVQDFSSYYTFPAGHSAADPVVVGDFATYLAWSGPRSLPPAHTWTELLPDSLVGVPQAGLTAAQRCTFTVVRAVSEVECLGFFDSLNAYDNAFVSLGPCHWTLGIVNGATVTGGELGGYLAYLRHTDNAAYTTAIEFFGMRPGTDWLTPGTPAVPDGRNLFGPGNRTYTAAITVQRDDGGYRPLPLEEREWNYFKTWHWFYRFEMATRTVDGFRRRMWDMARVRLRDLRALELPAGAAPDIPTGPHTTRRATVGDVFTSEKAMGLLLRWHIRYPAHLAGGSRRRLRNVLGHAAVPASAGDPARWTDAHEIRLIDGILREVGVIANADFTQTMEYVRDWPAWAAPRAANPRGYTLAAPAGGLATTRGSFLFDASGLPPAP